MKPYEFHHAWSHSLSHCCHFLHGDYDYCRDSHNCPDDFLNQIAHSVFGAHDSYGTLA